MIRDYFQRNIDLINQLRSQHFKYTEYINKGKYKLKQKFFGKGKKHYDFDINSQQYFHQEINDIVFQSSQIQQQFYNLFNGLIQGKNNKELNVQTKKKYQFERENSVIGCSEILNSSQCRILLAKHFHSRIHNLRYKKYLILERFFNLDQNQNQLPFVKSRTNLIDKQIQISINRQTRLSQKDYFQQSYIQGGKPIPISQTGQPIYKYLDEEDCWYSNISRDDVMVYTRNIQFKREMLNQCYFLIESKLKTLVFRQGVQILLEIQDEFEKNKIQLNKNVSKMAEDFNSLVEVQLQKISPGNLVQKQNLINFGYSIFGIHSNNPLNVPLYPAIYPELYTVFNQTCSLFFKNINFTSHQQIISLIPKLNSFSQIIFKYQNKQILQGQKEIKLGLQDDIDVRKQLITMLEQAWVKKHVHINFQRFNYKLELKQVDWPMDTITRENQRVNQRKRQVEGLSNYQRFDTSIQELIKIIDFVDFYTFRKHMKKRSQIIVQRAKRKYFDMENINHYNKKSDQNMTLEQLSELFRIKFNENQTQKESLLKGNAENLLNQIMKKYWIVNPVQIQLQQTIKCLKIRQNRTKIINLLNGMRCYHRNICLDLRVILGQQFKFKLDDQFLINSNKQVVQNFEKAIKQTATFFSKNQTGTKDMNSNPKHTQEFQLPRSYHSISMLYKKDIVECFHFNQAIPHILITNGNKKKSKIIYGIVLQNDLKLIQKRILMFSTFVINQFQRYIKIKGLEEIIDRVELLHQFYEIQLKYQYQKFKLIEKYYYIYENTTSLLDSFKISKIIIEIINKVPQFDFNKLTNNTFLQIYEYQIQSLKIQENSLEVFITKLKQQEQRKVTDFHKRYSQLMKVPLSAQVYLYRDIETKQKNKLNKLQRMNSISSRISSKSSKNGQQIKANQFDQRGQIKQEFDQENSSQEGDSFDIENYDEYLLRKDMDSIFDDMNQNQDTKQAMPVNTAVLQNISINSRFQGGPHPYNNAVSKISLTSNTKQDFLNFYQSLCYAANIYHIIQELKKEFRKTYGQVSKSYQNCAIKIICKRMYKILLSPLKYEKNWKNFQSYDPYHQTVTISSKFYEQIMAASLDPPSNIQMAIASTLQRHQQKLPTFNIIGCLDYHSIQSLITLKKPVNSASYRQLALGVNYLTFLNLRQNIYHINLQRLRLVQAYEKLASLGGITLQKFSHMYSRIGQNDILLAIQEIKLYKDEMFKYSVLPEVIEQLKIIVSCQKADIQLFETIIKNSKIKIEDFIIMKNQVGQNFLNSRFDNKRLLSMDQKNVKMIKNRLSAQLSSICNQQFKCYSFIKVKDEIKLKLDKQIKYISETNISSLMKLPKQKISQFSRILLEDKIKKKFTLELIECYTKDLIETNLNWKMLIQSVNLLKRIKNLINCGPYLRKSFQFAPEFDFLQRKILYDQKKVEKPIKKQINFIGAQGNILFPRYIYSRSQLITQWFEQQSIFRCNHLNEFKVHQISNIFPPKDKQLLFKWIFKIPDFNFSSHQNTAFQHFINFSTVFTGKNCQSQYLQTNFVPQVSRNKFYIIYHYYLHLLQYLQSNYLLISLQMQDEVIDSFYFLLQNNVNFQQNFQLNDQISINESLQNLQKKYLKTCYNYKESRQIDKQKLRNKLQKKNYVPAKEHWKVYDQILDFIVSKVQGRGIIRQNFLPLSKQIQEILISSTPLDFFKKKTQQIQNYFVLSNYEAYLNQQQQFQSDLYKNNIKNESKMFYHYFFPLHQWFLGNGLEYFNLQNQKNVRFNIQNKIDLNQKQSQRFITGVFSTHITGNIQSIGQRYKAVFTQLNPNLQHYIKDIVRTKHENIIKTSQINKEKINNQTPLILFNFNFLTEGMQIFNKMGEQNRLKLFARIRYYYDKTSQYLKIKNLSALKPVQKQQTKLNYIKFLLNNKIQSLSVVTFTQKIKYPVSSKYFKSAMIQLKQSIQISTYNIFERLQDYKNQNKIQFNKSQMKLLSAVEESKHDTTLKNIYSFILREVIAAKLTKEEFKTRVLLQAINVLKRQRVQNVQSKKIINTSLIPRVHLIGSYSSPLVLDRKTYISQQYKLAFAQAFINRFRNKVSRVDLLSSGYGFVITVPDLQDCVNFMNKLLFTFCQKEFKYRQQTHFQYFEIMVEAINEKNKKINQQKQIITYLQQKASNIMQAEYLGKVSKLLHEKTVIQDKLRSVQQSTNGIQDRIRKTVEIQYEKQLKSLTDQNEILKAKFNQFKELFVILTKDTAKNNFLNVANTIRGKIGDLLNKRIDISPSFLTEQGLKSQRKQEQKQKQKKIGVKQQQSQRHYKDNEEVEKKQYVSEDLQRCKLGQDIIHDPYYTTKLITKMRLFNIFKLGCKKINFQDNQNIRTKQLKQLHKIQDTVIAQSEREILVRQQLKKTQQELSKKVVQLEKIKKSHENMQNERTKLKILIAGKDKKIQQKQRQAMDNLRRLQQLQKLSNLSGIENKVQKVAVQAPKVSELRKTHRTKSKKFQKSAFLTNMISPQQTISIYDRFQLSNKDITWRQKCEQLYIENKKLLSDLQKLQSGLMTPARDYSLNSRPRKKSESFNIISQTMPLKKQENSRRFPNLSFKYNIMKQTQGNFNP